MKNFEFETINAAFKNQDLIQDKIRKIIKQKKIILKEHG